ncbi:MAG: AAA family ATPase [Sphingomonadaceae bacterium]|nr:AAA family ATPase [Sphingomonadaceae bacterium]
MYTDHYGLTAPPFQLTPDPRFWFESATHKKAMAYLGYGLAQGEGFIVVTGDIGAGKTTLVAHLMDTLDPMRVVAVKIVSTQVEGDDMLRMAAQAFGLPTEGVEKAQLLDRIERYLIDTGRGGRRTLLIVDEAQNLPTSSIEELRMLSNFQSGGHALLQIFLLGQPEFRDRLNSAPALEQMRQRVIATHHLDPMQPHETLPYLEHRLKLAGWSGNPRITDDAASALHTVSGGIPRKINTLATRALLMGALDAADTIDGSMIWHVAADAEGERPASPERPEAALSPSAPAGRVIDHEARLAMLETQMQEQEAALRRVLTLLVDWIEREDSVMGRARSA